MAQQTVKVPQVVTAVAATIEEAMQSPATVRQVLRSRPTSSPEAPKTTPLTAAIALALPSKAVATRPTLIEVRSTETDVVLQTRQPTTPYRRSAMLLPHRPQVVSELTTTVATPSSLTTEAMSVTAETVPRHLSLSVLAIENPRERPGTTPSP